LAELVWGRKLNLMYFFTKPSFPVRLWSRFLQLLFLTFFCSSLIVPRVSFVGPESAVSDFVEFFVVGFFTLWFLAPILVLIWTYQDGGLRRYDSDHTTVTPVGLRLAQLLAGVGTLGTFARFAVSVSQNPGEAVALGLGLFLVLFSPCLLLTSIFHRKREPKVIARLLNTEPAKRLGVRSVKLE
jgi:hypothetical protein